MIEQIKKKDHSVSVPEHRQQQEDRVDHRNAQHPLSSLT